MAEHPMETTFRTVLWQQFGAAIDMLENALLACPSAHWHGRLWSDQEQPDYARSGISPIIRSSGSTCISPAKQKDSLPRRTSGTHLTQVHFPNSPIPGKNSTAIWRSCGRSASRPLSACQTSKRTDRSVSPGWWNIR